LKVALNAIKQNQANSWNATCELNYISTYVFVLFVNILTVYTVFNLFIFGSYQVENNI